MMMKMMKEMMGGSTEDERVERLERRLTAMEEATKKILALLEKKQEKEQASALDGLDVV
jgi:hypothetical protein